MPSQRRDLTLTAAHDLVGAAFAVPAEQLCGIELEWPVHRADDPAARASLVDLRALIGQPLPYGGRITVEPGGQVELSTLPAATGDVVLDAAAGDAAVLHERLRAAGLEPVELALDRRRPQRILTDPRYECMEFFLAHDGRRWPKVDGVGAWMMCNTASLQVNISHDATDVARRWRLAHRLGPVLVAAFANSPGIDRAGTRWESLRQAVWWAIDPARTHPVGTREPGPKAWSDYALAADVMLIRSADETTVRPLAPGLPFGRWLADGHPAGWPTTEDLCYHLSTLFPPIRPRGWLEMRMLDQLPAGLREVATLVALTALTTDAGPELDRRLPETAGLWCEAARHALAQPLLAAAARTTFDVVGRHLDAVTALPARRDAVTAFAAQYVARATAPAQLVGDADLATPCAPDLAGPSSDRDDHGMVPVRTGGST